MQVGRTILAAARSAINVVLLVVCVLSLAACKDQAPTTSADAEAWLARELGWVEGADPVRRAADDRARKSYRFLSVCSLGCEIVGVSDVTLRMCYPDVDVVMADKTTQAVQSDRHAALKRKARDFAETYNRLVVGYLKANGEGACPPQADWDAAFKEISAALSAASTGGFGGDLHANDRRRVFQVRLPRGVSADSMKSAFCEILARSGLEGHAGLEVKSVDAQEEYAALDC